MNVDRRAKSCGKAASHSSGDGDYFALDDANHFLENPTVSVASLRHYSHRFRKLITISPESRSPSPECAVREPGPIEGIPEEK